MHVIIWPCSCWKSATRHPVNSSAPVIVWFSCTSHSFSHLSHFSRCSLSSVCLFWTFIRAVVSFSIASKIGASVSHSAAWSLYFDYSFRLHSAFCIPYAAICRSTNWHSSFNALSMSLPCLTRYHINFQWHYRNAYCIYMTDPSPVYVSVVVLSCKFCSLKRLLRTTITGMFSLICMHIKINRTTFCILHASRPKWAH